jgi:hypothetical protein
VGTASCTPLRAAVSSCAASPAELGITHDVSEIVTIDPWTSLEYSEFFSAVGPPG